MRAKKTRRFDAIYALTDVSSKIQSGEFAALEKTKAGGCKAWFTVGQLLGTWIQWRRSHCSTFSREVAPTP
jgi:hypothetical protein